MTDSNDKTKRRIIHIDMDAFFAAVEEQRRPGLAGRPVVIGGGGDPAQRGVVSTANYEARKFGIHSAMPIRTAYRLCPQAVFLPVDYRLYSDVSRQFKSVLPAITSLIEDVGIDEVYLDVSALTDTSENIIRRIKEGIKEKTGLTCSVGVAGNKLLAKIASDMQKPDGFTIMNEGDIESRLWPLPARKLYGIGPKTEAYLKNIGIETIGQLATLTLENMIEHFGNSYGQYLFDSARGINDSPLITHWEAKSISRETTFQEDVKNWQIIAKTLADLTREVVNDMRDSGHKAKTVTVKIRFSDFETLTRAKTITDYTNSEEEMRRTAFGCLRRIDLNKRVRLIGVRASNLEKTMP
ncbi:MAG: DNA polymerase IV [Smithellaceae bacterium]